MDALDEVARALTAERFGPLPKREVVTTVGPTAQYQQEELAQRAAADAIAARRRQHLKAV